VKTNSTNYDSRQTPRFFAACRRPTRCGFGGSSCGWRTTGTNEIEVFAEFRQHLALEHNEELPRLGILEVGIEVGDTWSQFGESEQMLEFLFEDA